MFGQLKESVLTNLEKEYAQNGETKFKKQFAKYVKVLKENKSLKEFNEIYQKCEQISKMLYGFKKYLDR